MIKYHYVLEYHAGRVTWFLVGVFFHVFCAVIGSVVSHAPKQTRRVPICARGHYYNNILHLNTARARRAIKHLIRATTQITQFDVKLECINYPAQKHSFVSVSRGPLSITYTRRKCTNRIIIVTRPLGRKNDRRVFKRANFCVFFFLNFLRE